MGANRPEEGVFGRADAGVVAVVCDGVFGRADGVFGLAGVLIGAGVVCDVRDDGRGRAGVDFGAAAFAGVDADVDDEGWYAVGGDFVDERAGVRAEPPAVLGLPDLDGVVGGGGLTAPVLDCRFATGLGTGIATSGGERAGSAGAGTGAGAGVGSEAGSGTGTVSVGGDLATPPSENLASWSAMLGLANAVDDGLGRGGHSRFSFCSIFSASPDALFCDVTLDVRGGTFGVIDWRFVCCSNRPMRLATLCLGRSSGNGL